MGLVSEMLGRITFERLIIVALITVVATAILILWRQQATINAMSEELAVLRVSLTTTNHHLQQQQQAPLNNINPQKTPADPTGDNSKDK